MRTDARTRGPSGGATSNEIPPPPSVVVQAARVIEREMSEAFLGAHPTVIVDVHDRPTLVP